MKTTALVAVWAGMLFAPAFTLINSVNWKVKEKDYTIEFSTSGAKGIIKGLKGTIDFDKSNPTSSSFDVTVDVNSLNTGNGLKNRHAKGESFLNAVKYPVIRFTASEIAQSSTGFIAKGKLTIKGISRDLTIPFTFDTSGNEGVFKGTFEFNRKDYELERFGIGEIITVKLSIPVNK